MPSIAVIRVVQRREDLRFALEACETVRITREGRRQDLDGDVALRLPIARAVDLTHSSSAEKAADLIARIRTPGARLISVSRCDPLQLFEPVLHDHKRRLLRLSERLNHQETTIGGGVVCDWSAAGRAHEASVAYHAWRLESQVRRRL